MGTGIADVSGKGWWSGRNWSGTGRKSERKPFTGDLLKVGVRGGARGLIEEHKKKKNKKVENKRKVNILLLENSLTFCAL